MAITLVVYKICVITSSYWYFNEEIAHFLTCVLTFKLGTVGLHAYHRFNNNENKLFINYASDIAVCHQNSH